MSVFSGLKKRMKGSRKDSVSLDLGLIDALQKWDKEAIAVWLSDTPHGGRETQLALKIIQEIDAKAGLENKIDLYGTLHNVIGYEIRDLTNKMRGGFNILTKDMDDNARVMVQQIDVSIKTLEDLAGNFNQIFTTGKIEHNDVIDLNNLVMEISTMLSLKIREHDGAMEAYFDKAVPPEIYGNHISFFWFLLLQLSSDINVHVGKNAVLIMGAKSADDIDKMRLSIDLIFTGTNSGISRNRHMYFYGAVSATICTYFTNDDAKTR